VYDTPRTNEEILSMLAVTPSRIAELTRGVPKAKLLFSPASGEWSARDVLAHLRACSDMWGKYIVQILNEDQPTIKAVNPTTWIKQTNYLDQAFQPLLEAFSAQRDELLAVLRPLPPKAWLRTATVTGAGRPRERSVHTYGEWLVNHERSHFRQLEAVVKTSKA
jgi:uncharacterized damage-inducible protein DinB